MSEGPVAAAEPGTPPAKIDPETLVLRGAPRAAVRFRRGLIIGVTGVVSACLVGVAWFALEPPSFRIVAGEGTKEPTGRAEPDALADVPATYGDVPRLGPPLPGDLGRPILEHRRELEGAPAASQPLRQDNAAATARAAAAARRQRLDAAREAARTSDVLVQLAGRNLAVRGAPAQLASDAGASTGPGHAAGAARPSSMDGALPEGRDSGTQRRPAPSAWLLSAGTIIPASLITGLKSDLPGAVIAQVTENVRDSATGRVVLVPQGSRLLGSYDNAVAFGQRRALIIWQRILFPDGSSVELDSARATDLSGYSGAQGRADLHGWRLLKGVALSTFLGVGAELGLSSGDSDLVRAVREATQQSAARAGDRITSRNLEMQPSLTVPPGWRVRAIIQKDLVLPPWRS
ncbi:MAG TPA: TrbI/VirB10 family protein [Sphingomonadaceae bacterium]|nr:TrbI/VirB10 family protein [Sphingomonadaceae bacterium]